MLGECFDGVAEEIRRLALEEVMLKFFVGEAEPALRGPSAARVGELGISFAFLALGSFRHRGIMTRRVHLGGSVMRHGMIVVAAALSLLSTPSLADDRSTWTALTTLGIDGTWATSCADAASSTNWRLRFYSDADGHVQRSADRGPEFGTLNITVDRAQIVSPTQVQMRTRNNDPNWREKNGFSYDLLIEVTNNQMRTLQSTRGDGTVLFDSSHPGPSMEKCSE